MSKLVIKHVKGTGSVYDVFSGEGWTDHIRVKMIHDPKTQKLTDLVILSKSTKDKAVLLKELLDYGSQT